MNKSIAATLLSLFMLGTLASGAERLVILHTNDTHSQLDPDASGRGGVLQRKALIDSVRQAEPNVILVDAGDVVQGSLFFKFFRGEVEYPLMDMMGYDIRILGNHEFDNGIADIARYYKDIKGTPLSANYDFSATELDGIFSPFTIREVGGRRIGFFGINVDPESLIAVENTGNLRFREIIPVANETAAYLKNVEHCDVVVAVTHIGVVKQNAKTTDYELASASRDIDIIIGGHSHTEILPGEDAPCPSIISNAVGKPVLVAQTGKYGRNLGYIGIDLDNTADSRSFDYRLIPVTDRFSPEVFDREIVDFLAPYRARVDSVNARVVARSARFLDNTDRAGGLANLTADIAYGYALHKADSLRLSYPDFPRPDFALMNVGGIRMVMPEGNITEGQILNTYPFSNHMAIASVSGADLAEALAVAASKGGESVSSQVLVAVDSLGAVREVLINGEPLRPDATYTYATIDYVLGGNDDLTSLANSRLLWRDDVEVAAPMLGYIENLGRLGITVDADPRPRFVTATEPVGSGPAEGALFICH